MYKGFKRLQFDTDTIYLNEQEIDKMYMLDLSKNKRLERIRDLFIVECLTGVRYGDLMKITKEDIFKDSIKIKVSKTGQVLHTLLLPKTKKILKKYNSQFKLAAAIDDVYVEKWLLPINTYINEENDKIISFYGNNNEKP